MNSLLEFLDKAFAALAEFFNSTNLQMFLLVGTGLLTVGLLILALTRWGHSRPLWKCVVLSVTAHILLLGYAYGTRLILVKPSAQTAKQDSDDTPLEINLVDESYSDDEIKKRIESERMSLNDFGNTQPLPEIAPLPRPAIDSEVVVERSGPPVQALPIESPPLQSQPAEMVNRFVPLPEASDSPELSINEKAEPAAVEEPLLAPQEFASLPVASLPAEISPAEMEVIPQQSDFDVPEETSKFIDDMFATDGEFKAEDSSAASIAVPKAEASLAASEPMNPWSTSGSLNSQSVQQPLTLEQAFRTTSRSAIRIGDGKPVPKMYQLRNANNRRKVLESRGGSIETEQAVEQALLWLANNQEMDGRWDSSKHGGGTETRVFGHNRDGAGANADTGITGLALLAFLAGGHSHLDGNWQETVRGGLGFLLEQQDETGSLAGEARLFARMYCHSMSLLAISEAWAMTGDEKLKEAVKRGVDFSLRAQNRYDGGWRYQAGDEGDMSQFGWQALAIHSAQVGGIEVPEQAIRKMHGFIERCAVEKGSGVAAYRPGHVPSVTMTAESLVSRYVLGQSIPDRIIREAKYEITGEMPNSDRPNLYYWYYGTMALYFAGGPEWEQWNEKVKSALLTTQEFSGANRGSWEPSGTWASYGGRVYSTAVSALILEVYYRYLPTTQQPNERFASQEEIRSR